MPVLTRPGFARAVALGVAGLACLTAVACGSGGSTADPLAGLTAQQVFTKAIADAKAAPTLKMTGTVNESGNTYTIDLSYKSGQGCTGTVGVKNKGSFAITVIGTTAYLNPDAKFWKSYAGAQASAVIALLNGRYIKGSTTNSSVASLAKLCDKNELLGSFKPQGTISKGTVTTLSGQQVLPINDTKGGTLYVTDTSTPQLVKVNNLGATGGSSGTVAFLINAPVTLTPPPASKVIDGSTIGF
jgi:hypothetical protein